MILCAVEDLMFSSKLRSAATKAGVELRLVRSPDALISEAKQARPSLIILDLNAERLRPIDVLASLRLDEDLAGVRIVGFVGHTSTDLIAAARAAGADEVLIRSVFVTRLPELIQSGA